MFNNTLIQYLYGVYTVFSHYLRSAIDTSNPTVPYLYLQNFHDSISLSTDVNSWLVTFGFQLYNVIPGYHKPVTDAKEPSYELIHTQMKTQEWDSTKVTRPTNLPSLNTHLSFCLRLYLQ